MGFTTTKRNTTSTTVSLLPPPTTTTTMPEDTYNLAYIMYFTLGTGLLLPYNAFITAVDYFDYLYPHQSVDRVFTVAYMVVDLFFISIIIFSPRKAPDAFLRINFGLSLFVIALLVVPIMDAVYIKGRIGVYRGFYVSVAGVGLSGLGDALVQGGLIGLAGELPERYMQAVVAGTSASGVLVSLLRIFTKAVYPQDIHGLRNSAILYFVVGIILMTICIVFYNVAHRLPIFKYYSQLKLQAASNDNRDSNSLSGPVWEIMKKIKYHGIGIILLYTVTLSIYPGFITEDVHSKVLKDWYPILLIASFNVFDLAGRGLTAIYLLENAYVAIGGCFLSLMFYPLYLGCLHGPHFFRTETLVILLTSLLGLTNGYITCVLMILAPKRVQLQHAEKAGILTYLFLTVGLTVGSIVSWFWVI